jgi:hypothetical protein
MDAKTRAAIEATIERWAKIATAEDPEDEYNISACPLCRHMDHECVDCPAWGVGSKNCDYPWNYYPIPRLSLAAWAVHDFAVSLLYQREE